MSERLRFDNAAELSDYLDLLNYDRGVGTAAVVVAESLWFAYCTDPDAEWYFESTDPAERMADNGHGDYLYERVGWDFVGPQMDAHGITVLWPLGGAA